MSLIVRFTFELYMVEALIMGLATAEAPQDPIAQWIRLHKLNVAYSVLAWTTLIGVKFSFLFFSKQLIKGLHAMMIYWWVIIITTAVVWAFGVMAVFLPCPYFSLKSRKFDPQSGTLPWELMVRIVQCAQTFELPQTIALSTTVTVLDIVIDISNMCRWRQIHARFELKLAIHSLVMVIPIRILWQI